MVSLLESRRRGLFQEAQRIQDLILDIHGGGRRADHSLLRCLCRCPPGPRGSSCPVRHTSGGGDVCAGRGATLGGQVLALQQMTPWSQSTPKISWSGRRLTHAYLDKNDGATYTHDWPAILAANLGWLRHQPKHDNCMGTKEGVLDP